MRLLARLLVLLACLTGSAQGAVSISTNYYRIEGNSVFELMRSMAQNRPQGWDSPLDAHTRWHIDWKYMISSQGENSRVRSFVTTTKIVLTLPLWTPGTNASPALVERWTNYCSALFLHEAGHIRIALAAEAEMRKQVLALKMQGTEYDVESLVNQTANKVLEEYHQKELQYDEQTRHGILQGARFPW
jgi:predicted secreted Zn-dependent protease